jgi:hypothetical protein
MSAMMAVTSFTSCFWPFLVNAPVSDDPECHVRREPNVRRSVQGTDRSPAYWSK